MFPTAGATFSPESSPTERERQLAAAVQAAGVGLWFYEVPAAELTPDAQCRRMWGFSTDAPVSTSQWLERLEPEDRPRVEAALEQAIAPDGPGVLDVEYRIRWPDGQVRHLQAHAQTDWSAGAPRRALRLLGSVFDVTAARLHETSIRQAAAQLEAQARLFDATLSAISDLAYTFDQQGRVLYANRALLEVWGRSLDEVVGKTVFDLEYPEPLASRLHGELLQVIATGQPISGETTLASASGTVEYHEYVYSPVFDRDGRVVAVAGTTRLATERKAQELELKRREQLYRAIGESIDFGIWICEADGRTSYVSDSLLRLLGTTQQRLTESGWKEFLHPDDAAATLAAWEECTRSGAFWEREHRFRGADGRWHPVLARGVAVRDEAGAIVRWVGIHLDIASFKKTEQALRESQAALAAAKEAAEAVNLAKDRFLAVLSHELRTPLTPVLMTAAALEDDPTLSAEVRADMAMIRRNVDLETKLIDDLLDLSRIASGKLRLRCETVALDDAVRSVAAICRAQLQEKDVRLHLTLGAHAARAEADPARLHQVFWNVLKNAAKFTPERGTVEIRTGFEPEERWRLEVHDSGVGIPAEALPHIFKAFDQGHAEITRRFGGLGLGLAISKAIVEAHGGHIRAESAGAGRGSTFIIELPATRDGETPGTTPHPAAPRGTARILVVEDHADTARALGRLLQLQGFTVKTAGNVAEALARAEGERFDVLLSDLGLPDGTGHDLMRRLRADHGVRGIAMSGFGMDDDLRRSTEAGFSEHLVKPVQVEQLLTALRRLLASTNG